MLPKRYTVGDIMDDMYAGLDYFASESYTFKGQIVDTEKFDIIPKRDYLEGEITRKEEELKRIEEIHKITHKQKQDEIDTLRKRLINKL